MNSMFEPYVKDVKKFGYFLPTDMQISGIKFGNWGSRPYEYFWAAVVEDVQGKDVLDIGTGTPTEHNWHEFVEKMLQPKSYLGIDFDSRLKDDFVIKDNHRVVYMDASNLSLPDNSIDVVYSISTFEHVDNVEIFDKIIRECHRVLRPNGKMIVTLDEYWDCNDKKCLPWNELERAYVRTGKRFTERSYGMHDFSHSIKDIFKPLDAIPLKQNADGNLLYSSEYNDCISYGIFEVLK